MIGTAAVIAFVVAGAGGQAASKGPAASLRAGFSAYRAGDYRAATRSLRDAIGKGLRAEDWALFLLGESEFYDGDYRSARTWFERAAKAGDKAGKSGRAGQMAPLRAADCLWMEGNRAEAAAAYGRLLKKITPSTGDLALARFRIAEVAAAKDPAGARRQFLALAKEIPAHPLSEEAIRRAGPVAAAGAPAPSLPDLPPADRLRRAESLTKDRHWDEALAELGKLPPNLPPDLAAERDYQLGMTKFHARRDYEKVGELLLATAPRLSGEKAASAQFHGARALSRADRDDDAVAGYRKVVAQFPSSRYAAEAQYLSGWLDYNRGRFKESIPALQATLDRFGKSGFVDDAAWCLAFAHFLLGNNAEAAVALERYGRLPATGIASDDVGARVAYWRARIRQRTGQTGEAETAFRELVRRAPLSYYGLLARARLKEAGKDEPIRLPVKKVAVASPPTKQRVAVVARAEELIEAGLGPEAASELAADEKGLLKQLGGTAALPALLALYHRAGDFRRPYRLAEAYDAGTLNADPKADEGTRLFWEAAYPRAYAPLVEKLGPPAGNPDLLLYAIMRKESGFNPHDVSYADARGLLQMIPPTSARVAATAGEPFFPDQLYDPEVNIRLGALFIGSLYNKFGKEIPLTAGAYNAGPKAMARWCSQHGNRPTDELIELIAFAQTREYAKRVTALYARYRYLYGPTPYEIPLKLDTKVTGGAPE